MCTMDRNITSIFIVQLNNIIDRVRRPSSLHCYIRIVAYTHYLIYIGDSFIVQNVCYGNKYSAFICLHIIVLLFPLKM